MAEFDLAALMKDVSRMDIGREQIQYIPYASLVPDNANGYSMTGVEDLARSIEIVGLQQPLRVRASEDKADSYQIISGHRRHAAIGLLIGQGSDRFTQGVPCIVDSAAASAALRELQLLLGNADNRKLTSADEAQQAERISDCLRKLEDEGYSFPGRHRDWVAKLSGMSRTKLARLDAIRRNLASSLLEHFTAGELGITTAYRLSQEKQQVQHEVYRIYGKGINDLTEPQLEEAINRRKAPRQDPPIKTSSKETVGWNVDAYLKKRRQEDDDFFEMLSEVAKRFFEPLASVNSRGEGIETLKSEYGKAYHGFCGPGDIVCFDSTPKGLTLYRHRVSQIFRTWTEVYDMLSTIALNRAALGGSWDEDAEDESSEELPTVRWEGRGVTPPQRELLLLYQLTNAGPKYTPAVYFGGSTFRKPAWAGHQGSELTGIAQQFSMWFKLPDPNSYGEEYRLVPPEAASETDTEPEWRTGTPEKAGAYWCEIQCGKEIKRQPARWLEDEWHFYNLDESFSAPVLRWWPLPEEE